VPEKLAALDARKSLIITQDPSGGGGVWSMSRAMAHAHEELGLNPQLAYPRSGRLDRWDLRVTRSNAHGWPALATGYWPSIQFLNYAATGIALANHLPDFSPIQVVCGIHSMSLVPILARQRFCSWIATPFADELHARAGGGFSVALNSLLCRVNERLERWTVRRATVVFALSDYTSARLRDLRLPGSAPVSVLRYPISTSAFTPAGPRWEHSPGRYLLTAGRVDDPRKNVDSALRSFAKLKNEFPDLHFVALGEVDHHSARRDLATRLGISARVHFPGSIAGDELSAAYRGAEGFLLTSRQEGLGIVVLEAQASALPCAVMRCGGSDELISDGETGFLVHQGDEDALANRLRLILSNRTKALEIGDRARRRVALLHSTERFVHQLRDAYSRDASILQPLEPT
jgi:glycosyltransferase involved in cell wall biosynthesis